METIEQQPNNPEQIIDPQSAELMEQKLHEAEKRSHKAEYLSEDGSVADLQKLERAQKLANESADDVHHEAGMALPKKASPEEVKQLFNKLIDTAEGDGKKYTQALIDNIPL